ncbi:MAG TPA: ABC transporter permease [Gemmatimonadales bacterium]|jgi:predicted permease
MSDFLFDMRKALRTLFRTPGFTIVAVLTLSLGIGANTALFSVVDAALLRPLPYPAPDHLMHVNSINKRGFEGAVSPADFQDWRRMARSFDGLVALAGSSYALSGDGPAEQLPAAQVSNGFFRMMRVAPATGRVFTDDETIFGHDHVVMLSDAIWRRRFGADRNLIGHTIRLNSTPYLVAGVMPRGFNFPDQSQIWVPLAFDSATSAMRGGHYLDVVGRLKPGIGVSVAAQEMKSLATRIGADNPGVNIGFSTIVMPLRDSMVGDVRTPLLLLLGAVGLVLLIACVNVANLLLARGTARAREHAVRAALGASQRRLISVVMAESLWLGLAGASLGLALAAWGIDAIVAMAPEGVPGLTSVRIDPTVMGFALAAGILTSLLFGALPALRAARAFALSDRLRDGGAALGGMHGRRSRQVLVAAEVALAVVLVVGAGLLLKSFGRLASVDPGFDPSHVLTYDVALSDDTATTVSAAFFRTLLERTRALPGVKSTAAIFGLPLRDFGYSISVSNLDGHDLTPQEQENRTSPQIRVVTRDYFRTLGVRTLAGRTFSASDVRGAPTVVVVSDLFAKQTWPGQNPIGHYVTLGTRLGLGKDAPRVGGEVIGVVQDVHDEGLDSKGRPWMYAVHDQYPENFMSVLVRTEGDPNALVNPARAVLNEINPDVPAFRVRTMEEWVSRSMATQRFYAMLIAIFAGLALSLAAVGVYGVLSQAVGERTREIGLRMALGAAPDQVTALVVRQGVAPASVGLVIGLVGALGASRLLSKMLFEVKPADLPTYAGVALLIVIVATLAAWLPARRAARVDPLVALRSD